jgi:signal transduction histidine kinase
VASSICPIKNYAADITNFVVIQDDITLQKEAELEKERLLQLSEDQQQLKQNFSNNMSHELLTPIHIISTATSIIDSKISDDELKKYIHYIRKATDDLTARSIMVLNMKRLENHMILPHMQQFSLTQLLIDVTQAQQPACALKNLQLQYSIAENVPEHLISDGKFLMQILSYLIDNAIKFTESGQITVSVKMANTLHDLVIAVTDTGIGVAESIRQSIFEPFQQGDSSSSRSYNGMGLGLTLAQDLAEALGGKISVKSTEGKGSIFTLALPLSANSSLHAQLTPNS